MPRRMRVTPGGLVFHVLNRPAAGLPLLRKAIDYEALERIMVEAQELHPLRALAWCLPRKHRRIARDPPWCGGMARRANRATGAASCAGNLPCRSLRGMRRPETAATCYRGTKNNPGLTGGAGISSVASATPSFLLYFFKCFLVGLRGADLRALQTAVALVLLNHGPGDRIAACASPIP